MPRIVLAIVSAAALTAAADAAPGPQIDGVYDFAATAQDNGKPDCLGESTPVAIDEKKETRIAIIMRNNGAFALCPDPVNTKDGTPYTGECWGEATPVAGGVR